MNRTEFIAFLDKYLSIDLFKEDIELLQKSFIQYFANDKLTPDDLTVDFLKNKLTKLSENYDDNIDIILLCKSMIFISLTETNKIRNILLDEDKLDEEIIKYLTDNIYPFLDEINYVGSNKMLNYLLKIGILTDEIIQHSLNKLGNNNIYLIGWYINYCIENPHIKLPSNIINKLTNLLYQTADYIKLIFSYSMDGKLEKFNTYYNPSEPLVDDAYICINSIEDKIVILDLIFDLHKNNHIKIGNTENLLPAIITSKSVYLFNTYLEIFPNIEKDIIKVLNVLTQIIDENFDPDIKYIIEKIFIYLENIDTSNENIQKSLLNALYFIYVYNSDTFFELLDKYAYKINLSELVNLFFKYQINICTISRLYDYAGLVNKEILLEPSNLAIWMLSKKTKHFIKNYYNYNFIANTTGLITTSMIYVDTNYKWMSNIDDVLHVKNIYEKIGLEFVFGQKELLMIAKYFSDSSMLEILENIHVITDVSKLSFDQEFVDQCFGMNKTISWLVDNGYIENKN